MWKIFGGVVVGVFVGAMAVEVLNRRRPELLERVRERARQTARGAVEAFQDGYRRPKKLKPAVEETES